MTTREKILLTIAIVFLFLMYVNTKHGVIPAFSGVNQANEYQSVATRAAYNGTAASNPTILCTTPGALGSVTITGANTGIINFYDGTSTAPHADYATTTLASIPASAGANTYVFDVIARRGLVMEIIGTVATATVSYRCN